MSNAAMENLISSLVRLRSGTDSESNFRKFVNELADQLHGQLSPGIILKLRRGALHDVMEIAASIVKGCNQCMSLQSQVVFNSRVEHAACAEIVDRALKSHILVRVPRPAWVAPDSTQLGADAYFSCYVCDSIWSLVEPEMHSHGFWKRIA